MPRLDTEAFEAACRSTWDEWDRRAAENGHPDHLTHAAETEQIISTYLEYAPKTILTMGGTWE